MARALALAVAALALVAPQVALAKGKPLPAPNNPPSPRLSKAEATRIFLADGKVASWLRRYPQKGRTTETTFKQQIWTVSVWWGKAGEIATGKVEDTTGVVTEAWTGPQVAWKMARGYSGAFGGKQINGTGLWLAFCAGIVRQRWRGHQELGTKNSELRTELLNSKTSFRVQF